MAKLRAYGQKEIARFEKVRVLQETELEGDRERKYTYQYAIMDNMRVLKRTRVDSINSQGEKFKHQWNWTVVRWKHNNPTFQEVVKYLESANYKQISGARG